MSYRLPPWGRHVLLLLVSLPMLLIGLRFLTTANDDDFMQPAKSLSHLHGVGVDAVNDRVLLATHHGLSANAAGLPAQGFC